MIENPMAKDQKLLKACGIQKTWKAEMDGKPLGAAAVVTVAVIDTGVDYTHKDLRANIWTNTGEILTTDRR